VAEKVAKLGIVRDKDHMLHVRDSGVWRVRRKVPGVTKARPEMVGEFDHEMNADFVYFIDRDGDVSRARRALAARLVGYCSGDCVGGRVAHAPCMLSGVVVSGGAGREGSRRGAG
jgi:hypothetical protein